MKNRTINNDYEVKEGDLLIIKRQWCMSNKNTFTIKPIRELINKYLPKRNVIVDPFANESKIGTVTNDINPEYGTTYNLDALDFLQLIDTGSADMVLYDPPYSSRQVSECYKGFGYKVTKETTQSKWRAMHLDEIKRILKVGGICISFGWNSNGVGKKRGFEIIELLVVPHGGSKNDTIVTVEQKINE